MRRIPVWTPCGITFDSIGICLSYPVILLFHAYRHRTGKGCIRHQTPEEREVERYGGCLRHPRVPVGTYPSPAGAPPGYPRPDWCMVDEETGFTTFCMIGIPPELTGEERRRYEDEQRVVTIAEFEETNRIIREERRLEAEQKERKDAEERARLEADRQEKLERRRMRKEKLKRMLGLESGKG